MLRVIFGSDDLKDFESASPDDHVKLFIPDRAHPETEPQKRDFTPRAFEPATGSLTIDFALHETGPATEWARNARVGDAIEIGGPRGSTIVPDDFDWYLLIGDETAMPAIGRWVEKLPRGRSVTTFCVIADGNEIQKWNTAADHTSFWLDRSQSPFQGDNEIMQTTLARWQQPPGDGFVWIAAEASAARSLRDRFAAERQHPKSWMKAAGYWKRGTANAHVKIDD